MEVNTKLIEEMEKIITEEIGKLLPKPENIREVEQEMRLFFTSPSGLKIMMGNRRVIILSLILN